MSRKVINILDYPIILLVILNSQSVYSVSTGKNYHLLTLLMIAIVIRVSLSTVRIQKKKIQMLLFFLAVWVIYISFYALISQGDISSLFTRFVLLFSLLCLFITVNEAGENNSLIKCHSDIIFIIAIISLVFWSLGSVFHFLSPNGTMDVYWGADRTISSYYGLYFQWQNDAFISGIRYFRNIGIFTEAPMYSLHLSIAFLYEYLIRKEPSKIRLFIIVTAILSTISTTGILLVILSYMMKQIPLLFSQKRLNWTMALKRLIIPFFLIMGIFAGYQLLADKLLSSSGSSRVDDFVSGFKAWMENPVFGAGYGDISTRIKYSSVYRLKRSSTGYTNSIMAVLAEGGIYWLTGYLIPLIYAIKNAFRQKNINEIIYIVMLMFLFVTTTFQHTALIILLMCYGYIVYVLKLI